MAGELRCTFATGATVYARLSNTVGQWWRTDTSVFEAYNAANWTVYDIALTEQGASGVYAGTMPAAVTGLYEYECRVQVGGSPAVTDPVVAAGGTVDWSGTVEIRPSDVNTIKTQAVTCAAGVTVRADVGAAAAPGAENGMLIAGTNAATIFASFTCTAAMSMQQLVINNPSGIAIDIDADGIAIDIDSSTTAITIESSAADAVYVLGGTNSDALSLNGQGIGVGLRSSAATITNALTAGSNALPWNAAWDVEIQSEVADALAAFTGDTGITLAKALEMLAAFIAGKVSRSSFGGVTTLTYKKRDGSTTSFTCVADEDDGDRATTGSLS